MLIQEQILQYSVNTFRGVAQFGRALRSGRRGRKFESCHLDQKGNDNFRRRLSFPFVFSFIFIQFSVFEKRVNR